jgi:hypothetical protein
MFPFGWTGDAAAKPIYCVTLMVPPTYPFSGSCHGCPWGHSVIPRCHRVTSCHRVAKQNYPKQGPCIHKTWAHKVIAAYRARVARTYNLPSLEVPIRGTTIDQVRASPSRQMCWTAELDSVALDQRNDGIYPQDISL